MLKTGIVCIQPGTPGGSYWALDFAREYLKIASGVFGSKNHKIGVYNYREKLLDFGEDESKIVMPKTTQHKTQLESNFLNNCIQSLSYHRTKFNFLAGRLIIIFTDMFFLLPIKDRESVEQIFSFAQERIEESCPSDVVFDKLYVDIIAFQNQEIHEISKDGLKTFSTFSIKNISKYARELAKKHFVLSTLQCKDFTLLFRETLQERVYDVQEYKWIPKRELRNPTKASFNGCFIKQSSIIERDAKNYFPEGFALITNTELAVVFESGGYKVIYLDHPNELKYKYKIPEYDESFPMKIPEALQISPTQTTNSKVFTRTETPYQLIFSNILKNGQYTIFTEPLRSNKDFVRMFKPLLDIFFREKILEEHMKTAQKLKLKLKEQTSSSDPIIKIPQFEGKNNKEIISIILQDFVQVASAFKSQSTEHEILCNIVQKILIEL